MLIGNRLRSLREDKKLSQADIEKRSGLLRCYISRVENGYTIPAIKTLEKLAGALEVPLYQIFYDGRKVPALPIVPNRMRGGHTGWAGSGKEARFLRLLNQLLACMDDADRRLLFYIAQKIAGHRTHPRSAGERKARCLTLRHRRPKKSTSVLLPRSVEREAVRAPGVGVPR